MGREAAAAATCLRSGNLKDMQLWLLMYGRLFRSIRESCLVTDPSEVFLPLFGPLRSLVTDPSKVLLWTSKGFVVPHWGGLYRGRSFNDNTVKNPFNECLQSMHPLLS